MGRLGIQRTQREPAGLRYKKFIKAFYKVHIKVIKAKTQFSIECKTQIIDRLLKIWVMDNK